MLFRSPGEAPANDLGKLAGSIRGDRGPESLTAILVAGAPYAVDLEYGTSKMAPRPFLRPAAESAARQGPAIVNAYVQKVLPAK